MFNTIINHLESQLEYFVCFFNAKVDMLQESLGTVQDNCRNDMEC